MPGATSDEIAMMQGGLAMKTDRTVTVKDTNEAELRIIRSDNNEFISNDWGFLDDVYILNRPFNVRKTEGWHYISRIYELELNSEVQNSKELVMLSDVKGKDSNAAVIKETEAVEKENPSKETATQKPTTEQQHRHMRQLQYLREREFTQRQQLITAVIFLFLKLEVMAVGKMIIRHLFFNMMP